MMNLRFAIYLFLALVVIIGSWQLLDLPSDEEMKAIVIDAFATYGLIVILISAFIEGLLLVGVYFPGSIVIFIGVALAPSPAEAVYAVILTTVGLYLGYLVDYTLGRYGWYRLLVKFGFEKAIIETKEKLAEKQEKYIVMTFWAPGFAMLTATAAGILQMPFVRFGLAALIVLTCWNIFWGILAYTLGEAVLAIFGPVFILTMAFLWILFEASRTLLRRARG